MMYLVSTKEGKYVYDFDQGKSLGFIFGGNQDYFITADIYPEGKLEEDKRLIFTIDKSNIDFYNIFNSFFNSVKNITLKLKAGQRNVYFPPYEDGVECHNLYDINELYDETKNLIKWPSEAGNIGGFNLNADTVMFIEGLDNEFKIIFVNDELCKINERYARNVCICNSGSKSHIFPYLYWDFFQKLKELPMTMSYDEAETKILRK